MMQDKKTFPINYLYTDRKSKQKWVVDKYGELLESSILDVGADQMYIKNFLPETSKYVGVGLGDHPDHIVVDLDKNALTFKDNEFETVLCLDVLEHLEEIHKIFAELCRVSDKWVIISLPNPWNSLLSNWSNRSYSKEEPVKFYGLPLEKPEDRHRWFFSSSDSRNFVDYQSNKNGFEVYDRFVIDEGYDGLPELKGNLSKFKHKLIQFYRSKIFRNDFEFKDIYEGSSFWVLKRK